MTVFDPIAELLGSWSQDFGTASILFRLVLSFIFSAAIGCERSSKRHSAGLRTFIVVSLGATAAMLVDLFLMSMHQGIGLPVLSGATVVGIGILSTYSILFSSKSQIKGLTTAVSLWACAVMGLAVGAGLYTVSLAAFIAFFFSLYILPAAEKYLKDHSNHFEIHLELNDKQDLGSFTATLRQLGLKIDDIESNPAYLNSGLAVYSISLTIIGKELKKYKSHNEIIEALSTLDYVSYIEELV